MKEGHRVVLVEFCGGKPFSVVTQGQDGYYDHYDFEWCKKLKCHIWNESGGSLYLEHGDSRYWAAESVDVAALHAGGGGKVTGKRLKKMPRRWPLESLFDEGLESDAAYCSVCDDWLPTCDTDNPCEHVHWCDKCGWWSGEGSDEGECGHEETA